MDAAACSHSQRWKRGSLLSGPTLQTDDDAAATPPASVLSDTGHPLRRLKIESCVWYVCQLSDTLIPDPNRNLF